MLKLIPLLHHQCHLPLTLAPIGAPCIQARLVHNVAIRMLQGLFHLSHFVIMDNFFLNIAFFVEFLDKGTYA